LEFHSSDDSLEPENIVTQVDATPTMKEIGSPFCAYGFPAEIYDPPVTNYTDCEKLIWTAYTFLVTMPSFLNGETISFIAGFQWGYIDTHLSGSHRVEILPIQTVDSGCWNRYVQVMKSEFPKLHFSENTTSKQP